MYGSGLGLSTAADLPSVYSLQLANAKVSNLNPFHWIENVSSQVEIPVGVSQSFALNGSAALELPQIGVSFSHGPCVLRRHRPLGNKAKVTEVLGISTA